MKLFAEEELKFSEDRAALQSRLDDTSQLLNHLQQVQHDRLSAQPPAHLTTIPKPKENETSLAEKITENLTEISKKLPPSAIAPVDGLRKAMGIAPMGGNEPMEVEPITHNPTIVTDNVNQISDSLLPTPSAVDNGNLLNSTSQQTQINLVNAGQMQISINQTSSLLTAGEPAGVPDLESELREFLESDPTLGHSPLHDDKTLEDILSES